MRILWSIGAAALLFAAEAPAQVTPWDVYLACSGPPRADVRLRDLCALRLPVVGASYTDAELDKWAGVLGKPPSDSVVLAAARDAEAELIKRASQLGSAVAHGMSFTFAYGDSVVPQGQSTKLARWASDVSHQMLADTLLTIDLVGFADVPKAGDDFDNAGLARARAAALRRALITAGADSTRIHVRADVVIVASSGKLPPAEARRAVGQLSSPRLSEPTRIANQGSIGISSMELAVGATDFLLERARDELERYVLQRGLRAACLREKWDVYLTSTCRLRTAEGEQARFAPGLDVLRAAIREDLHRLPFTVAQTALDPILEQGTGEARERAYFARVLTGYGQRLLQGADPITALDSVRMRLPAVGGTSAARERVIRLATTASAVHSGYGQMRTRWTGNALRDSLALYSAKYVLLQIAGGAFGEKRIVRQDLDAALVTVRRIADVIEAWEDARPHLNARSSDSVGRATRAEIVASLLSRGMALGTLDVRTGGSAPYLALAEPVTALVEAVALEDRDAVLLRAIELVLAADTAARIPIAGRRLLSFGQQVAGAQSADDVRSALSSLVDGGPGYLGKREYPGMAYFKVSAYVGGAVSYERTGGNLSNNGAGAVGLALPVGLEVGRPWGRWSAGLFLQAVDLGGLASLRLDDDDELDPLPDFALGSVVAPGAHLMVGFPGVPVAAGFGFTYTPMARRAADGTDVAAVRWGFTVGMDIPLFP